jgi:hypothetical protein
MLRCCCGVVTLSHYGFWKCDSRWFGSRAPAPTLERVDADGELGGVRGEAKGGTGPLSGVIFSGFDLYRNGQNERIVD